MMRPVAASETRPLRVRIALLAGAILAAACQTQPTLGGAGSGTVATGSAAGSTTSGASPQLESCPEALGTLLVVEDTSAPWFFELQRARLGPTAPVLRMMVQQSNCFVVVERGRAMGNVMGERGLERSGEARAGSDMGPGQLVVADYTLSPSVQFAARGTEGLRLGGFGAVGNAVGTVAGSVRQNQAATTLLMVDNRSGVQIAAATGSAQNWDVAGLAGLLGGSLGATGGAYGNTPEGRIVVAALMDAYNQLVRSTRNYRAQQVRGGLGTGGALGVQGGSTPAAPALPPAPPPPPPGRPPPPPPR